MTERNRWSAVAIVVALFIAVTMMLAFALPMP